MKNFLIITSILLLTLPIISFAHCGQDESVCSLEGILHEEEEGKALWNKLQTKEITCQNLSEDDFEKIGEFFMGKMAGTSHESINQMMSKMMGKEKEEQMHIVMGKRFSGCESNTEDSGIFSNLMVSMMVGMSNPSNLNSNNFLNSMMSNMMSNLGMSMWGFGILGGIFSILLWALLIIGIIALIRWVISGIGNRGKDDLALEILKQRYARSEISREEFEQKKKELM